NLVTSRAIRDELDAEGIKRLDIIPRGVDVINRHPDFRDSEMRDRLSGGKPENKLLVFIGRLAVEKEIHKLLPLLDARKDISLAIVGDGPARRKSRRNLKVRIPYSPALCMVKNCQRHSPPAMHSYFPPYRRHWDSSYLNPWLPACPSSPPKAGRPTNRSLTV